MQSATVDGSDVKTIISTNSAGNKVAIGILGNNIFYADNKQLLMVPKLPGSTPTALYNDTMRIESVFVFNQLGMFYLKMFLKETVSIMIYLLYSIDFAIKYCIHNYIIILHLIIFLIAKICNIGG